MAKISFIGDIIFIKVCKVLTHKSDTHNYDAIV